MKISDAVQRYVHWKREYGYQFERSTRTLRAFSETFPGMEMTEIDAEQILIFLNRRTVSTSTWRLKFWTISRFFQHWSDRGEIPIVAMPTPRPIVPRSFVPYVFTTSEVRALLMAISESADSRLRIDEQTLRTIILFLYGTGASVGELASIERSDVDTESGFISITSTRPGRSRRIPIGPDLNEVLKRFLEFRARMPQQNSYLFTTKRGLKVSSSRLARQFRRLRRLTGVRRRDGSRYEPRVDDLRYTFAVHRITKWIEDGLDLNRMLPALAAYMGQIGLGSTERYLFMTPERFRQDLDKLSPTHGRGMWCENHDLMKFLSAL